MLFWNLNRLMARKKGTKKGMGGCSNGGELRLHSQENVNDLQRPYHAERWSCSWPCRSDPPTCKWHKCTDSAALMKLRTLVLSSMSVGETCKHECS